jgi:hypothetical protein
MDFARRFKVPTAVAGVERHFQQATLKPGQI